MIFQMSAFGLSPGNQCSLKIVAFLKNDELYPRVNDLVERVYQEGHQIILFGEQMVPIFQSHYDSITKTTSYPSSKDYLKQTLPSADVMILLTSDEDIFHEIPARLNSVIKNSFDNQPGFYSWTAYGLTCLLIGGSVHSRKVAMNLRQLLDNSDYPFFGRVLPEPCSFGLCYDVDSACETEQPCVL